MIKILKWKCNKCWHVKKWKCKKNNAKMEFHRTSTSRMTLRHFIWGVSSLPYCCNLSKYFAKFDLLCNWSDVFNIIFYFLQGLSRCKIQNMSKTANMCINKHKMIVNQTRDKHIIIRSTINCNCKCFFLDFIFIQNLSSYSQ